MNTSSLVTRNLIIVRFNLVELTVNNTTDEAQISKSNSPKQINKSSIIADMTQKWLLLERQLPFYLDLLELNQIK